MLNCEMIGLSAEPLFGLNDSILLFSYLFTSKQRYENSCKDSLNSVINCLHYTCYRVRLVVNLEHEAMFYIYSF